MTEELMVDGLRALLVLAAMAAVADVWWQTGTFERRLAAEAKRAQHLRSLVEVTPPSIEEIRAAWLEDQRTRLHHLLDNRWGDAESASARARLVSSQSLGQGWGTRERLDLRGEPGRFRPRPLVTRQLLLQPAHLTRADAGWDGRWGSVVEWQDGTACIKPVRGWEPSLATPGDALRFTVTLRASGQCVGDVSLWWLDNPHQQGAVEFVFDPTSGESECAGEVLGLVLQIGFAEVGLRRIVGRPAGRSQAVSDWQVLEQLGMRREPNPDNRGFDAAEGTQILYAMTADDWFAEHPPSWRDGGRPVSGPKVSPGTREHR